MDTILSVRAVSRDFYTRGRVVHAVAEVSLDVAPGEFLTVVGPSGCGKSTLLNSPRNLVSLRRAPGCAGRAFCR